MRASDQVWIALGFDSCSHGETIFKLHNEPKIMEGHLGVKDEDCGDFSSIYPFPFFLFPSFLSFFFFLSFSLSLSLSLSLFLSFFLFLFCQGQFLYSSLYSCKGPNPEALSEGITTTMVSRQGRQDRIENIKT